MNTTPLLTAIVPIYNVEKYLSECIESILKQSYSNLEVILVDDGAVGKEPIICDKYAQADARIKVIHKKNAGLVAARKTGVENAHGTYVTFVDGDDYIAPNYYSNLMNSLIQNSADLICCGYTYFSSDSCNTAAQCLESGIYSHDSLVFLRHNMNCYNEEFFSFGILPSTCMKIYKTELLKKTIFSIPEAIHLGEDFALSFPYILNCNTIVIDNSINGYMYRYVAESMSNQRNDGLFIESSTLYNYVKPYYDSTNDEKISTQLEYYRAYLIRLAIMRWEYYIPLHDTISAVNKLREHATHCTLLSNLDTILALDIPRHIRRRINWIKNGNWIIYKLHMITVSIYFMLFKHKH